MWGLLALGAAIYLGTSFAKEALEKPNPPGVQFDHEAYHRDSCDPNVSFKELQRKVKSNYYATSKPRPPYPWEAPEGTVIDVERYEYDKIMHGEEAAEMNRKHNRCVVVTGILNPPRNWEEIKREYYASKSKQHDE